MKAQHTLGPWELGAECSDDCAQIISADGGHIAYVECDPIPENARLIAAAPELLMALREILDATDMPWMRDRLFTAAKGNDVETAQASARAAIAKATA